MDITNTKPKLIKFTDEMVSETIFDRDFAHLKKDLQDQKKLNWQIIIGVALAFIFTIGLVGIEVMLFHTS